jgi:hypothetical protein
MKQGDALFFYQLLLPLHDPQKNQEVGKDERQKYYSHVHEQTNGYFGRLLGGGYTPNPRFILLDEHVKFDGILYLHGALGSKHDIGHRWKEEDGFYQPVIAVESGMSHWRWKEIKRFLKLCENTKEEAKQGTDDFNPAYKFDYIWECIVHNVHVFTQKAGLDLVIDESTWGFSGMGGPFVDFLVNKIKSRGGQTVLLMDSDRLRPRGYLHRQKNYRSKAPFPTKGMTEVFDLISRFVLHQVGEGKLWPTAPHLTVDNYFNGDEILNWMGQQGLGMLGTVARNRLPRGIEGKYFHKEAIIPAMKARSRLARLAGPITMVKDVPADEGKGHKAYRRVHCSFQSTGPCNLGSVNSIPSSYLYVKERTRGRGQFKRRWGIEMNQARELYLQTYGKIDQADSFIARSGVAYKSWKYYHSAVNQAKALAIAVAHDMYLECAEGKLDPLWKLEKGERLTFNEFQQRLGKQMIRYMPSQEAFPGDSNLRQHKQSKKKDRGGGIPMSPPVTSARKRKRVDGRRKLYGPKDRNACPLIFRGRENEIQPCPIDLSTLTEAVSVHKRLCFDLKDFKKHVKSKVTESKKSGRVCRMCGLLTNSYCSLCSANQGREKVHLCWKRNCYINYHSPSMFGLGRDDRTHVCNKAKHTWVDIEEDAFNRGESIEEDNYKYIKWMLGEEEEESDIEESSRVSSHVAVGTTASGAATSTTTELSHRLR